MSCPLCHRRAGHICLICGFTIDAATDVAVLIAHQERKEHTGGHFVLNLVDARNRRPPRRFRTEIEELLCDEEAGANVPNLSGDDEVDGSLIDELKRQKDLFTEDTLKDAQESEETQMNEAAQKSEQAQNDEGAESSYEMETSTDGEEEDSSLTEETAIAVS